MFLGCLYGCSEFGLFGLFTILLRLVWVLVALVFVSGWVWCACGISPGGVLVCWLICWVLVGGLIAFLTGSVLCGLGNIVFADCFGCCGLMWVWWAGWWLMVLCGFGGV